MAKKSYTVVYRLKHDGVQYKPGETVQMDVEQAASLLARGTITDGKTHAVSDSGMPEPIVGKPKEPENKAEKLTADPGSK